MAATPEGDGVWVVALAVPKPLRPSLYRLAEEIDWRFHCRVLPGGQAIDWMPRAFIEEHGIEQWDGPT